VTFTPVIVRDDKIVIGHSSHLDTDALEVYVDGLLSDRRMRQGLLDTPDRLLLDCSFRQQLR
jgi:hypothetical protein